MVIAYGRGHKIEYDACLGHIDGATSACCGHGVKQPYITGIDLASNRDLTIM